MQASKVSINQIFDFGSTLFIPFFQRSYVWDTEEWKRFLSDMQQLTVNNEEFFLGTVVFQFVCPDRVLRLIRFANI